MPYSMPKSELVKTQYQRHKKKIKAKDRRGWLIFFDRGWPAGLWRCGSWDCTVREHNGATSVRSEISLVKQSTMTMAPEKECFVSHTCVSLLYLPTQCQKPTIPRFLLSDWEISLNCGQSTEIKRKFRIEKIYHIFGLWINHLKIKHKPIKCGGQMYQIWAGSGEGDKDIC